MSQSVSHFIDQPSDWATPARCLIMRGWCFALSGLAVRRLYLRTPWEVLPAMLGLPRPDVRRALPVAPSDFTGFEIRGILPAGKVQLQLVAELSDGTTHLLWERQVAIARRILPLWWGNADWTELMFFQMAGHARHPRKALQAERYPRYRSSRSPQFAVVTPSFQQSRFLPETLNSVVDQRNALCTYIVQDGGSTDGSSEIVRSYGGKLAAFEIAPDRGQADAIAKGFAKTTGTPDDLMAWINSDDFYLPGALAYVANYFARHPEVDVIYGHRILVDENSQEIGRWFLPRHDAEVLKLNDFVPQETMFWRRRIWDHVGGIDTSFKFAMDWDLLLRFQAAGANIVRLPYFLACFRIHAAQKTTAQMHSTGQEEITRLRERTFGRPFPAAELESNPILLSYLRRSAFIESCWELGIRLP